MLSTPNEIQQPVTVSQGLQTLFWETKAKTTKCLNRKQMICSKNNNQAMGGDFVRLAGQPIDTIGE